jgi:TonB family protein
MKSIILAPAILGLCASSLFGSTNPAAQQMLVAAEQQAGIFQSQSGPFQLEVDFVAQVNVPLQGHYTLQWESKDRWRSKAVMGPYQQIKVQNGEKSYTFGSLPFTPLRVQELINLIHFARQPDGLIAKKLRQRAENGVAADCLQFEQDNFKGDSREVCLDSASHEILSEDWQEGPDSRRREEFSDYFDFSGHRFPHQLVYKEDGIKVITANVISLTSATFDENLLVAPKGAIERRICAGIKHATPIKTPDPAYPKSARANRMMGDTTIAMTVEADGTVSGIHLTGKATESMDDATLETLKTWRFKPAMCGDDPVVTDITVVVSFRLY